ncbi:MAG: DUF5123 domain-containing protein [Candidatus Cryptobacteroides sp.]
MKKFIKLALAFSSAFVLAVGCSNVFEEETDIVLTRCLEPTGLSAKVIASKGNDVVFSWNVGKDAEQYTLEVYEDKEFATLYSEKTLAPDQVPFTMTVEADATYYFRVQASSETRGQSNWAVYVDDSQNPKSIKTFAVKDPLYLKLAERASTSLKLVWSNEVADYKDVTKITYGVSGAAEEDIKEYELTADDIENASATLTDLVPSTEYVITLYFLSASRGEIVAWTLPSMEGLTEVSTSAALEQAIKDGAKIALSAEGSPYTISAGALEGGLGVSKGFEIHGIGGTDGSRPEIVGTISILSDFDGGSILFEGVKFNGSSNTCGFAFQRMNDAGKAEPISINSVVYRNCEITGYSKGLFYEWGKTFDIGEFLYENTAIYAINADGTGGGDGFDVRGATNFGKLSFANCTIYNGFRTLLRLDPSATVGALEFNNNTVMNVCFVDNTNNGGIFGLQIKPDEVSVKKNLFLYLDGKATLTAANAKYVPAADLGVAAQDNFFYGCVETISTDNMSVASLSGTVLSADPCYNAKAGLFNINPDSEIAGKEVGASAWWSAYVEEPENLTLEVIEGAHTWNLADAKYFSGTAKKHKVRDYLYIAASENNPIALDGGKIAFANASVCNRKGLPTDGYLCFKVNKPGSVLVRPVEGGTSHIIVATAPAEAATVTVKGGASEMSEMSNPQKILISDITEETLVYVYASGPIAIDQLAWSNDISQVNTALPAPAPKSDPATVVTGEPTDITISWDPVENAGSYSVVFNGKNYPTNETVEGENPSCTIGSTTIGMLDPGSYRVYVYANPAADDIYNTMSEAGVAAFAIQPAGGSEEEGGAFAVKNVDELNAALAAQKPAITLLASGSPYHLDETLVIDYPVELSGENSAVTVEGAISFPAGTAESIVLIGGDIVIRNLTFDDTNTGKGCFITLTDNCLMGNLTVDNVNLVGYGKSVIYGNFAGTYTGDIVFRNITTSNWGAGQGVFDFRKGSYCCVKILASTFKGGRDFIRMDAAVKCGDVVIRNNTFDGCNAAAANGNGVLYVRASTASYIVANNLFLNEIAEGKNVLFAKASGVMVPDMRSNFYYNIDEANFFSGIITREIATEGNGVVLTTDPVKDSANGDYTLVSGLAMSCRVGDPRWNPSYDTGSSNSFTVKDTTEFRAAVAAGKTDITLEAGEYELNQISVVKDMRLTGNGEVKIKGYVDIAGEDLGKLVFDNIHFVGGEALGNVFNVSAASAAVSVTVKNCIFDGFTKSVWYDNAALATNSLLLSNNIVTNHGTGQGVFDIRKGSYTTVTLEQNTIIGGRDLIRADAGTITGAFTFRNNTVDGSNLGVNGNGIMYVRATPTNYIFNNNLIINEVQEGKSVILAKATGVTVPSSSSNNFFWNIDQDNFFNGVFDKTAAAAVVLNACPVKDAANGDYTLVDALAMSCNVGARRWNPKGGVVTTEITVNTTEELINAISVGKTSITLNSSVYDFTLVEGNEKISGGVYTIEAPLTLKGSALNGVKPMIIGSFKLDAGVTSFIAQGIVFDGKEKTLGNAVEIANPVTASKIELRNCELNAYSKSAYYHASSKASTIDLLSISNCTVSGFGTGQGVFDIRSGVYGTVLIENSTICEGGRDFIRADASTVVNSIVVKSNTFANTGIGAGNGLLWVRATAESYIVADNLFINELGGEGTKTLLAKAGATKATMQNNHFYNCDPANFWTGTYTQEEGTANGGSVLEADPCVNAVGGDYTLTNAELKAKGVGAPKWR